MTTTSASSADGVAGGSINRRSVDDGGAGELGPLIGDQPEGHGPHGWAGREAGQLAHGLRQVSGDEGEDLAGAGPPLTEPHARPGRALDRVDVAQAPLQALDHLSQRDVLAAAHDRRRGGELVDARSGPVDPVEEPAEPIETLQAMSS